jgi:hypothetical protein
MLLTISFYLQERQRLRITNTSLLMPYKIQANLVEGGRGWQGEANAPAIIFLPKNTSVT